ncbi:hydrolase [Alteromonas sediminis]|uniref:Hydrolase n=1 Tax=Alteromonas sediminis TaxID=2259342 RepID=A0A3N5Y7D4_9ALTE|nr:hydrolase [Alteromonas sediminis]RPJ66679.1 hydrolase [Alteromonas sediminis]
MTTESRQYGKIIRSSFRAPAWARNRHVQTIWPRFIRRPLPFSFTWERVELPDGDFVDLAWGPEQQTPSGMVILFHGLEGSVRSHYANDMMAMLSKQGWRVVMMHFRGCSGEINRTPRAYHSGDTQDALFILKILDQRFPDIPKTALGVSLGGNMLLKLLGENPASHGLAAAVAISAPLKLAECSESINQGFSRVYQRYLLKSMKRTLKAKMQKIDYKATITLKESEIDEMRSFKEFDDKVTAPLHGFVDAEDYYEKCSAFHFLSAIHCPTLILHAIDDPFMNHLVIPDEKELARHVTIELSETGGHVGFMQGLPWNTSIWLHQRVIRFFTDYLSP